MTALGFAESAQRAYLRLLTLGPMTNAKLGAATALGEAGLFEVTRDLRQHGLIVGYRHRGRTAWYCADPASAWLSLAAAVTWTATARLTPIDKLPRTGVRDVDERSTLYRAALRPALELWCHAIPAAVEGRDAHSAGTLAQLAVEVVRIAQVHVRSISASPKISGAAQFWPALVAQMNAGVRYTRLTDLNELYEHGVDVVRRDLAEGVTLLIGLQEELTRTRGYIADRRVMVRYDEASPGDRPQSGFMTSDKNAIERFLRRYKQLAETALPGEMAVDHLAVCAGRLREAAADLSTDAVDWFDELIRMGRFSTLPTERAWSDAHREELERELTEAEVAARSTYGVFLPCWPEPSRETRSLQAAHFG